jgi:ribonucleoside-diphosphate reductase alpha chain
MRMKQNLWVVKKRDGRTVPFEMDRIGRAIENAFRADVQLTDGEPLDAHVTASVQKVTDEAMAEIANVPGLEDGADVETIQDLVEVLLMRHGHYRVARRYIVYRAEHSKVRAIRATTEPADESMRPHMVLPDGHRVPLDEARIRARIREACKGLEQDCVVEELHDEVVRSVFDGITESELARAQVLAVRSHIERDPAYDAVTSRLLLGVIYREALGSETDVNAPGDVYRQHFEHCLVDGINGANLSPALRDFDLPSIAAALAPERDHSFQYLGLQTLYDRYLLHVDGRRIETPQYFWMRVAMGLAIAEKEPREERAIAFYNLLSTFRFCSATPTLFNAATVHPQLSSCYLTTVGDDLEHIFKCVGDNARLSKWAGGLGNDWTSVRATNAPINGTKGRSQGVIPFLKVVNDTAVAVNQGGKRKGAVCSYLETWHLDLEEFLELRKNTGDDRRRTHDMHTANWIPDLFMRRVQDGGQWTLFSPDDVPDLHDLYGKAFNSRYEHYERKADAGSITLFRRLPALDLWRKMLTRLFETGHPWITWKDPSNIRSTQDHRGVIHSSNLCTEILLNTSREETAVCNLGSVNLKAHIRDGMLDKELLADTVETAMRMLDNVVDINFYPTPEARAANERHRPVGLGLMGFQDALTACGISYESDEAVRFADTSMEAIAYHAILGSVTLARERGAYGSYVGSKWDRGLLPLDTIGLLEKDRGEGLAIDKGATIDWEPVRAAIAQHGMRNSNCLAIAPTATISAIVGVSQSIEPTYKHLYVKSNLSGEFTQVNGALVNALKKVGLWDRNMVEALKFYDGSLGEIARIPEDIKHRFKTAFEIDPHWLIASAAHRQKWIDMGQSLNLYLPAPSGKKLHDIYFAAWQAGLKTTYYLRTLAATQVEKSTVDVNKFGIQPRWMKSKSASSDISVARGGANEAAEACDIMDPDCEACQ